MWPAVGSITWNRGTKAQRLYYFIGRSLTNFYDFFRYSLPQGIAQCWAWFPIIWRTRDWDADWLMEMMEFKIMRLADSIEEHGIHLYKERDVRQMRICAHILKRLQADDYDPYIQGQVPKKMTKMSCERSRDQMLGERKLLFKIMERHMLGWWD